MAADLRAARAATPWAAFRAMVTSRTMGGQGLPADIAGIGQGTRSLKQNDPGKNTNKPRGQGSDSGPEKAQVFEAQLSHPRLYHEDQPLRVYPEYSSR